MLMTLARPAAEAKSPIDLSARVPGVLVVDDEEPIRHLLQVVLHRQGFDVWQAADGLQALRLYDRFRFQIDLVLLDVRMPGMDGPQTLGALKRMNPGICCCFLTGHARKHAEGELQELGASGSWANRFFSNCQRPLGISCPGRITRVIALANFVAKPTLSCEN